MTRIPGRTFPIHNYRDDGHDLIDDVINGIQFADTHSFLWRHEYKHKPKTSCNKYLYMVLRD